MFYTSAIKALGKHELDEWMRETSITVALNIVYFWAVSAIYIFIWLIRNMPGAAGYREPVSEIHWKDSLLIHLNALKMLLNLRKKLRWRWASAAVSWDCEGVRLWESERVREWGLDISDVDKRGRRNDIFSIFFIFYMFFYRVEIILL